jgi:hypothetical protein
MQEAETLREALIKTQQGAEAMMNVIQSIRNTEAMSETSAGHLLAALSHDKQVARDALLSGSSPCDPQQQSTGVSCVRQSQGVRYRQLDSLCPAMLQLYYKCIDNAAMYRCLLR